jgi:uncharacterized membrane protein
MFRLSNTEANATTKYGAILGRHYTNAEENVTGMLITSTSSATGGAVSIGGGISAANAVNNVLFYTAANNTTLTGTERMRITSTGNVGIGTTDPSAKLEVIGDAPTYTNASTIFWGGTTNNDSYNGIMLSSFGDALGGSLASNLLYSNSNTPTQTNTNRSSGQIKFENTTIASKTSDINFGGYYKGTTTFIERMRINSDGNVGIGTTDPSQKLDVNGRVRIGDVNYSYGGQNFHIVLAEDTQDAYITNVEGYGIMSAGGYYYGGNLRQLNSNSTAYSAIHLRQMEIQFLKT